ncbi:Uncharacterised protein [Streptococcus equi subsp. equi]|nr:Uncharacterised protein [Streptococcus equi subsp. equi]
MMMLLLIFSYLRMFEIEASPLYNILIKEVRYYAKSFYFLISPFVYLVALATVATKRLGYFFSINYLESLIASDVEFGQTEGCQAV